MQQYITHNIIVNDKKGNEFKVIILENTRMVMTTCSCNGTQKCYHVSYCLTGNNERIAVEFIEIQKAMIHRLNLTKEGKDIIKNAQRRLESIKKEEHPFQKLLRRFSKNKK